MNERIKELALEAFQPINSMASEGVADYYTFEQTWFQLYNQKFAELIIRECCKEITQEPFNAGAASLWLKDYFGVEL